MNPTIFSSRLTLQEQRTNTGLQQTNLPITILFVPHIDKQHQPEYIAFRSMEEKYNFNYHIEGINPVI